MWPRCSGYGHGHVRRQRPHALVVVDLPRLGALDDALRRRHDLGHLVLHDLELALADLDRLYVVAVAFSEFVDLRSEKTVRRRRQRPFGRTSRTPGKNRLLHLLDAGTVGAESSTMFTGLDRMIDREPRLRQI